MLKLPGSSVYRRSLTGVLVCTGLLLGGFWAVSSTDELPVSLVLEQSLEGSDNIVVQEQGVAGKMDPFRFAQPVSEDKPWMVWHWPGTNVRLPQIIQELTRFSKAGFGGVEIHFSGKGIPPLTRKGTFRDPVWRYLLMETRAYAEKLGLQVSWTLGPGIPAEYSRGQLMLTWGEIHVLGGKKITCAIPAPDMPVGHHFASSLNRNERQDENWLFWLPDSSRLIGCWAAKVLKDGRRKAFWNTKDYIRLDPDSTWNVTGYVQGDTLMEWDAGPGWWKLLAVYETPSGATPFHSVATFSEHLGDLLSPYDLVEGTKIHPQFEALPHDSTGRQGIRYLPQSPTVDRILPEGFDQFLSQYSELGESGFLPLILCEPLRDHERARAAHIVSSPPFVLSDVDHHFRNAYEQWLINEPFQQGLSGLNRLIHNTGSSFRMVVDDWPFGWEKICQAVDQPAFNQDISGGNRLAATLVAGLGYAWGRKHTAAYVGAVPGRAYSNTPSSLKQQIDLAHLAGANRIYVEAEAYQTANRGRLWHPGTNPYLKNINEGGQFGDDDALKKWWPDLWSYVSRTTYLQKLGEKHTDVYVLYPFTRFPAGLSMPQWEMIPGYDPAQTRLLSGLTSAMLESKEDSISEWIRQLSPYLVELEQSGISWDWITESMMEEVKMNGTFTGIRLAPQTRIIVPAHGTISLSAAQILSEFQQKQKADVLILGDENPIVRTTDHPDSSQQVLNHILHQLRLPFPLLTGSQLVTRLTHQSSSRPFPFLVPSIWGRKQVRKLKDGSFLVRLINTGYEDEEILLSCGDYTGWELNPYSGQASSVQSEEGQVLTVTLSPHESRYFWLGESPDWPESLQSQPPIRLQASSVFHPGFTMVPLEDWDWTYVERTGPNPGVRIDKRSLVSWTEIPSLSDVHGEVTYSTDVFLDSVQESDTYILDLGKVHDVVEIEVNTQEVSLAPWPPYVVPLTKWLQPGLNTIRIWVRNTRRNEMISRAIQGDPSVGWLQDTKSSFQPAGLLGPVVLWKIGD